jgi:soluble lytic murein transglycosylase-like protein
LRRYPRDPVTFVERIPYSETRGYVRTVLRNRAVYAALYGGGGAMP